MLTQSAEVCSVTFKDIECSALLRFLRICLKAEKPMTSRERILSVLKGNKPDNEKKSRCLSQNFPRQSQIKGTQIFPKRRS